VSGIRPTGGRHRPAAPVLGNRALNRALLERQMLVRRVDRSAESTIQHLVGMQAQAPLVPYVGLWTRLAAFRPSELVDLLERRRVVRANGMLRTTIHLLTARDALTLRPILQSVADRAFASSPFARDLAGLDVDEVVAAGRSFLAEEPLDVKALGERLGELWPGRVRNSLAYAVRFRVPTVQVLPRGLWGRTGRPVAADMESYLGQPVGTDTRPDDLVMRYLAAFGPASTADIRTWSWLTGVREVIERLRPRLRTFRDERGRELLDLPDAPLPHEDTPAPVRFFPEYDNVFLSHDDRTRIIPAGREWYLQFPPGNGGMIGTFTVDGYLAGTWRIRRDRDRATLAVKSLGTLPAADRDAVELEATALLSFVTEDVAERTVELGPAER
jgi:hypothetical protein